MSNFAKAFNLTQEQADRCAELLASRDGVTPRELVEQLVELGLYQLEYRRKSNLRKRAEVKEMKQVMRLVNQNPELMEQLGLARRVDVSAIKVAE